MKYDNGVEEICVQCIWPVSSLKIYSSYLSAREDFKWIRFCNKWAEIKWKLLNYKFSYKSYCFKYNKRAIDLWRLTRK